MLIVKYLYTYVCLVFYTVQCCVTSLFCMLTTDYAKPHRSPLGSPLMIVIMQCFKGWMAPPDADLQCESGEGSFGNHNKACVFHVTAVPQLLLHHTTSDSCRSSLKVTSITHNQNRNHMSCHKEQIPYAVAFTNR